MPGEAVIRALPSFLSMSWEVHPGDFCSATVDMFTRPGVVQLVHPSAQQVKDDAEIICSMGAVGLLDFTIVCPVPPVVGAVVVIDPFSSGANLAALAVKMGYKLIICFSEANSPVAKLVAKNTGLTSSLVVHHDNLAPDQAAAEIRTLDAIKTSGLPILAILPGAETGVDLADKLAARFGTRNNGTDKTAARRNKYLMQECVRSAGLRAVKQTLATSVEQVQEFYSSLLPATQCVLKPNESAGSDSVYLCGSLDEAIAAYVNIAGKENGLGHINSGALCQEFLSGNEFVIDGVSRDGVYKVSG
jgi:biotin carboxylase